MALTGAYLTIIYTVLLHFTFIGTSSLAINIVNTFTKTIAMLIQGLVFISYPLIGLLADIKLTRYGMICLSCWVLLIGHATASVEFIIGGVTNLISSPSYDYKTDIILASIILSYVIAIVGKGMFESTVIQFGTDQMIEASSAQLSVFTHWYYWSLYIGNLCINVIVFGIIKYISQCYLHIQQLDSNNINIILYILAHICIIQSISCCIVLVLLYSKKLKSYLNIEPVGVNPIKRICDVLKYAYHHKYPVRRSALSYYQNTYPSRIDFGKVQYGGPFTNEQVEDTKTVLRLLVLLLSLFGFHLSSDGLSTSDHILYKSCPSSLILLYLIGNPSFLSQIITIFGIPLFHFLLKSSLGKYTPNMIKRMWFGTFLLFVQEIVSLIINSHVTYFHCHSEFFIITQHNVSIPSFALCFFSLSQYVSNTEWNTTDCVNICPSSLYTMDGTLVWLLVPHILHGFGYMLVFVSVLEFICAQAPFRLKGFVIGSWYAMLSIKYIFVNIVDEVITLYYKEGTEWIIYESIKIAIIGLSLIIFGISCRWYRYRERDEVVNVQGMIEEIFEKELLQQNEENNHDSNDEDTLLVALETSNYCTFNNNMSSHT